MNIEYLKIKSFGNIDNLKITQGDMSPFMGKGEVGLAALTAFQLFLFYGAEPGGYDILPYLNSAKGPVAGGYALLTNEDRRYLVAREYFNGEERLLIRDADTDIEININTSAGEFFFSRTVEEFMHGSEGAPVDISDILKTARIDLEQTSKVNANEILMLRDKLDSLGKKQMRLSAESMAARGVNPAERLRRAREVQKELLEADRAINELSDSEKKTTVMKKKVFFGILFGGGAVFIAGILLLMLMQYISVSKSFAFFLSLFLIIAGGAVLLWAGIFKFTEYLLFRNMPNRAESLAERRSHLAEKLDILLDGADFEELERQAAVGSYSTTARSLTEIEKELSNVRAQIDETRKLLNEKISA